MMECHQAFLGKIYQHAYSSLFGVARESVLLHANPCGTTQVTVIQRTGDSQKAIVIRTLTLSEGVG